METGSRIDQENMLAQSRKDMRRLGIACHFSGEFALIGIIGKAFLPGFIHMLTNPAEYLAPPDNKAIALGLFVYAALQVPALIAGGLSMSQEEHEQNVKRYEEEATEHRQNGQRYWAFMDQRMSNMSQFFANHHETSTKVLNAYSHVRDRFGAGSA